MPEPARNRLDRLARYFHRYPILCLAILTPGIPEYLSTSSPVLNLAADPLWFFLGLAINIGQYTGGALLIREAVIRWRKGWATVFALGLAYGITEEGLGDNTLFNSAPHVDGVLGVYGRFLGVNWVWATGVLAFHVIYSIGLPILLLGLALPETRGRSLLGRRGIATAFGSLAAATATEAALVWGQYHFWMGLSLLGGASVAIVLLVLIGWGAPEDLWAPRDFRPSTTSRPLFAVGFAFFPIAFLLEYGVGSYGIPPSLVIAAELVAFATLLEYVRRSIGRVGNERLQVDLAFGFLAWQAVFGILLTIALPYTLPLVGVMLLFFVRLRRAYPPDPGSRIVDRSGPVPAGARLDSD